MGRLIMNHISITDIHTPGLEVYASLTEAQLRNRLDPGRAIFIAESPKVIRIALGQGYKPISLLCEERHLQGDAADIVAQLSPETPVYTGTRDTLATLTGYTLTRGVLCAMRRPELPSVENIIASGKRVAVIDGVVDTTNIGAIFRSAAALGIDAVLVTPSSCDPLNRRAVRVSMGTVFLVPWTFLPDSGWQELLRSQGYRTVALALTDRSVSIDDPALAAEPRLAMILGTEGDGLANRVIEDADYTAKIPMYHGVDSLNVASASAVAFYALRAKE